MSKKKYLIGPENFDTYILVLKIVLAAVFLGITIASIISAGFGFDNKLAQSVFSYGGAVFSALIQAFVWVTVVFAIIEYNEVDISKHLDKEEVQGLRRGPRIRIKTKADISWSEPVVSMIFSTAFMAILLFAPNFLAVYIPGTEEGLVSIPFFDLEALKGLWLLITAMFVASILKEVLKLVYGKWSVKLAASYCILTIISLALFITIFFNPNVWNANLQTEVLKHVDTSLDFMLDWNKISNGALIFILAIHAIDMASAIYKGIKHDINRSL